MSRAIEHMRDAMNERDDRPGPLGSLASWIRSRAARASSIGPGINASELASPRGSPTPTLAPSVELRANSTQFATLRRFPKSLLPPGLGSVTRVQPGTNASRVRRPAQMAIRMGTQGIAAAASAWSPARLLRRPARNPKSIAPGPPLGARVWSPAQLLRRRGQPPLSRGPSPRPVQVAAPQLEPPLLQQRLSRTPMPAQTLPMPQEVVSPMPAQERTRLQAFRALLLKTPLRVVGIIARNSTGYSTDTKSRSR
jgi:hypothetical protein